jgi:hypothetical protein
MRLDHELVNMNLPPSVRNELLANRTRLAAIEIPSTLDPKQSAETKNAIANSFLLAFRLIACSCAALALSSAATATLLIEAKKPKESITNGATRVPAR